MTMTRLVRAQAAVAALLLLATGCEAAADKAGGRTVELVLATIDGDVDPAAVPGPAAFVQQLEELSGGQLRVKVITEFGGGQADAESQLVAAIADGELDGGWPATRAFAGAGIRGMEAVEAPLAVTSYDAQRALLAEPAATALLDQLEGSGVVGLGLTAGPLRRPFGATRLARPDDWTGKRVRTYGSPVQTATVRALGGTPVDAGLDWAKMVQTGRLDGAEFGLGRPRVVAGIAHMTANVALWPKVDVLSLSAESYDDLTEEQRGWVHQAAELALAASVAGLPDEATALADLCSSGTTIDVASPADLRELRLRVQEVHDDLAADPETREVYEVVAAIEEQHPAVDGDVPEECTGATTTSVGKVPSTPAGIPDGEYRAEISVEDVALAGMTNDAGNSGTWTLTVDAGGFALSCRPLDDPGLDCGKALSSGPLEIGDLRGRGDLAWFVGRAHLLEQETGCESDSTGCVVLPPYRMTWTLTGDQLVFRDLVPGPADLQWLVKPWTRIG